MSLLDFGIKKKCPYCETVLLKCKFRLCPLCKKVFQAQFDKEDKARQVKIIIYSFSILLVLILTFTVLGLPSKYATTICLIYFCLFLIYHDYKWYKARRILKEYTSKEYLLALKDINYPAKKTFFKFLICSMLVNVLITPVILLRDIPRDISAFRSGAGFAFLWIIITGLIFIPAFSRYRYRNKAKLILKNME